MRPKSACRKHVQQARRKGHKELNTQEPMPQACRKHATSAPEARHTGHKELNTQDQDMAFPLCLMRDASCAA